jgi:hypothetical protein
MTAASLGRNTFVFAGLLFLLSVAGCGSQYQWNERVEGSLKSNGVPLVGVVIDFVPEGKEAMPISVGVTDQAGHFEVRATERDGAVVGKHKIVVHPGRPRSPFDPQPVDGPSATPIPPASNPAVPTRYTLATSTPLQTEVTPDKHSGYDFDLVKGTP